MRTVTEVLRLYDQENRSRSRGGLYAISGFAFQVYAYLAVYAALLVKAGETGAEDRPDDQSQPGFVDFESLSDYLIKKDRGDYVEEGDSVVCVQAKRTLTRETLSKAAEEFVAIDRFLEAHAPERRPSVRFEVVAAKGKLGDPASGKTRGRPSQGKPSGVACWEAVTLSERALAQDRRAQERLDTIRREGRLLPPRIDPDPWWRLIGTVFHELKDPFGFAYEATALCLERGLTPDGAGALRVDISRLFTSLRRDREPAIGQVMRASDFEPLKDQSKAVVVGQIPTPRHLRDGCFMRRDEHLGAALGSLDQVLDRRLAAVDPRVHTLWVTGRSGGGKSVLLLHLMRELVIEREARVIWLKDSSSSLIPLLESWRGSRERERGRAYPRATGSQETPYRDSEPIFVFVDDFYSPDKRSRIPLPELRTLVRHDDQETHWPVLVTCGPPEQHSALTRDHGDCGLKVNPWTLPPATREEGENLKTWFTRRTGRTPKTGDAFGDDEGLMVSMVFELERGDLSDFALRFKRRLEDERLVEAVLPVLALNRLYLQAPAECLSESQWEALHRINQDDDFDVVLAGSRKRLRLTHPHLSDAIYRCIRVGNPPDVAVKDLLQGFKVALGNDPDTAIAILDLIVDIREGWRVGREEPYERMALLPQDSLARRLAEAWVAIPEPLRQSDDQAKAWVWVLWAQLGSSYPEVRSHIPGAPTQVFAALKDQPGHPQWFLIWFRLLSVYGRAAGEPPGDARLSQAGGCPGADPIRGDVLTLGLEWLKEHEARDAYNWTMVWLELVEPGSDLPAGLSVPLLLRLGFDWLKGHEDSYLWEYALGYLLGHRDLGVAGISAQLLRYGFDWLKGHEEAHSWNEVRRDLLGYRDLAAAGISTDLLHYVIDWLKGNKESYLWGYVWRDLLGYPDLAATGLSAELVRLGFDWLKGHQDSASWGYVWRDLLNHDDLATAGISSADLLRFGFDWLKGREDSDSWYYAWRGLLDRDDLATAGISGLELVHYGFDWLKGHEGSCSWGDVWRDLLGHPDLAAAGISGVELLRLGSDWLKGHETDFFAGSVLAGLLDHPADLPLDASLDDVLRWVLAWLADDWLKDSTLYPPAWPTVFLATLPHLSSRPADLARAIRLGQTWLGYHSNEDDPGRSAVEAALATAEATLASSQAAATDDPPKSL